MLKISGNRVVCARRRPASICLRPISTSEASASSPSLSFLVRRSKELHALRMCVRQIEKYHWTLDSRRSIAGWLNEAIHIHSPPASGVIFCAESRFTITASHPLHEPSFIAFSRRSQGCTRVAERSSRAWWMMEEVSWLGMPGIQY